MELVGKTLIAMPNLDDGLFSKSVIVVCEEDEFGTSGIIINKVSEHLDLSDVLGLVIPKNKSASYEKMLAHEGLRDAQAPYGAHEEIEGSVYRGGPVEQARGFVIYASDQTPKVPTTRDIGEDVAFTASQQILKRIAARQTPHEYLVCIGRCSWEPRQLETEILSNHWLIGEVTKEILFHTPDEYKWAAAVRALGFQPEHLSNKAGRA